jgi:protein-S-isoprenylcysteine O-methyltransferase Ste14
VKRDTRTHLDQSLTLSGGLVLGFVLPRLRPFKFTNRPTAGPLLGLSGIAACLAGMGLLVWARQTLGKNWSQTVSPKQDHELIRNGPYRWLRHPMYAGGLLASIASAGVVGGPFVFLTVILGPLFVWRVRAEDRLMENQFPEEYPAYKQTTNALIPRVW